MCIPIGDAMDYKYLVALMLTMRRASKKGIVKVEVIYPKKGG